MKNLTIINDRFEDFRIEFLNYGNKVKIALFSDHIAKDKINWEVRMFDGIYHLSGAFKYKEIAIKLTDTDFYMKDAFRTESEYNMWINRTFDEVKSIDAWEL